MNDTDLSQVGPLALVGSGEYLPGMADLEGQLLRSARERGKSNRFIQIPLAAGRESKERLQYWRDLGADQASRLDAEQVFLPIFSRDDALNDAFAAEISDAGLIYLSGGDPAYLATELIDTPVWRAIESNWRSGSALAGCSAGAMALCADIPHLRKQGGPGTPGLNVLPALRIIPHYNKFFGWIPDSVAKVVMRAPDGVTIIGIDEMTAAVVGLDAGTSLEPLKLKCYGVGAVHVLKGAATHKYHQGEVVELH